MPAPRANWYGPIIAGCFCTGVYWATFMGLSWGELFGDVVGGVSPRVCCGLHIISQWLGNKLTGGIWGRRSG